MDAALFVDHRHPGDGLRIEDVDRLAKVQALVEAVEQRFRDLVGDLVDGEIIDGADRDAGAADLAEIEVGLDALGHHLQGADPHHLFAHHGTEAAADAVLFSLDGDILLQGFGAEDDGRPESPVEIGSPIYADRRKLLRAGRETGAATGAFVSQDGGHLALLPADRAVQAGPEAAAALAALLRFDGKGPGMCRLRPRGAGTADGPFLPHCLARFLLFFRFFLGKIRDMGHRAGQFAGAAAGTLGDVDIAGPAPDGGRKIARLAAQPRYLAPGHQFDVHVPSDLHQFRRDDAHRTVVGRKGLVQLGHLAADRRRAFHQIDLEAGIGEIEGRLHAADATADDHYGPGRGRRQRPGLCHISCIHRVPSLADPG
jgi:hypothetical protein